MREKRKGFTLIELLAVIVILAIIALIATPIVLNLIKSAKKGAFVRSVEGVLKSAKTYYLETLVNMEPKMDVIFNCDNSKCISGDKDLGVTGSMGTGTVIIRENGNITFSLTNNTYCAIKYENSEKINIKEGNCSDVDLTNDKTRPVIESINTSSTTNSITVVVSAKDEESGISYYEYSIDGGLTYEKLNTNIKVFDNLNKENSPYQIKVKVYNGTYGKDNYSDDTGMVESDIINVSLKDIDEPITYVVTFDATGGEVETSTKEVTENDTYGELPTPTKDGYNFTGWYTSETDGDKIESETNVTITANQTLYAHWEIPTGVKAILYLDPTDLIKECHAQNSVSTTGTKSGCMKWYAYAEDNDTYTMILDHNTTATVSSWSEASTQLTSDTTGWIGNPRLISGQEIADITGNASWTSTGSWFYLDSNNQSQTATSEETSRYYWLYDYTSSCTTYGCKVEDSSNYGYWTSTSYGSSRVWRVDYYGRLGHDVVDISYRGVRPVITISKSNL